MGSDRGLPHRRVPGQARLDRHHGARAGSRCGRTGAVHPRGAERRGHVGTHARPSAGAALLARGPSGHRAERALSDHRREPRTDRCRVRGRHPGRPGTGSDARRGLVVRWAPRAALGGGRSAALSPHGADGVPGAVAGGASTPVHAPAREGLDPADHQRPATERAGKPFDPAPDRTRQEPGRRPDPAGVLRLVPGVAAAHGHDAQRRRPHRPGRAAAGRLHTSRRPAGHRGGPHAVPVGRRRLVWR